MPEQPFCYGSVCSGIEAATVAWHPLGWTSRFFAEIEPFPSAVLAHHYPEVPNLGDFTAIDADAGPIDLLVGGTPCQDFSVAGLRAGLAGERGNLTLEFLRLLGRLRPRWVVWENVPGILSNNGGRSFGAFLGGLGQLGYGWSYRVLDAQYFGVPQRRQRVFVVGCLGDERRAGAVLFERDCLRGHPAPRREAGSVAAGGIAFGISSDCFDRTGEGKGKTSAERSGLGISEELSPSLRAKRPNAVAQVASSLTTKAHADRDCQHGRLVADTLTVHHGRLRPDETFVVAHTLRGEGFDASEDGTVVAFDWFASPTQTMPVTPECPPLKANMQPAVAFASSTGAGWYTESEVARVRAETGGTTYDILDQGTGVRRLTPRECERLQGFPDDWTLIPYRGKAASDSPRYRAIGNSMAVPVMRWIGQRIALVHLITTP